MKLLVVAPCYYPATRFGGPVQSIHALARGLASLGTDVSVCTTNSNGTEDLSVPLGEPVEVDGVTVRYFPVESPRGYFRAPQLRRFLAENLPSYDLAYIAWMYVYTTAVAWRECVRAGVPYVMSPRGMLDRHMIEKKGSLKKRVYLAAVDRRGLEGARAIHFTSEGEREVSYYRPPPERSLVVPNGLALEDRAGVRDCDAALAARGVPSGKPLVLYLGRLSYKKGLDLLAAAWPAVIAAHPQAHLVIAGPDDEGLYAAVERDFAARSLRDSMTYVGFADEALKACLLERCVLLVSPSLSENFGMSIVEAMAARRPVVITDRVNIWRNVEEAGAGVVTACDAAQIGAAMARILSDPQDANRMGEAGRRVVAERFSIAAVAGQMRDALQAIVNKSTPTKAIVEH